MVEIFSRLLSSFSAYQLDKGSKEKLCLKGRFSAEIQGILNKILEVNERHISLPFLVRLAFMIVRFYIRFAREG
jgi:hypothetical protein